MRVKITRIDKSLPLPVYETEGSVGFDLLAREDAAIQPKSIELIPRSENIQVIIIGDGKEKSRLVNQVRQKKLICVRKKIIQTFFIQLEILGQIVWLIARF